MYYSFMYKLRGPSRKRTIFGGKRSRTAGLQYGNVQADVHPASGGGRISGPVGGGVDIAQLRQSFILKEG